MVYYNVGAANTNRLARFMVQGNTGAQAANLFHVVSGPHAFYPRVGRTAGNPLTPTNNQQLAQLRLSLAVRALSVYMPPAFVALAADSASNANGAFIIAWETDQFGLFFNNAWMSDTTQAKFLTTDIVDTVGTGGMSSVKTKAGLNSLLQSAATRSFDGGTTGPFGALSSTGAIVLPTIMGGGTTSGAPSLNGGVDGTHAAGLQITYIGG